MFGKDNSDELPEPKSWDHAIKLIPNANANLDCKVYPLNHNEQEELNKFLKSHTVPTRTQVDLWKDPGPGFQFIKKSDPWVNKSRSLNRSGSIYSEMVLPTGDLPGTHTQFIDKICPLWED